MRIRRKSRARQFKKNMQFGPKRISFKDVEKVGVNFFLVACFAGIVCTMQGWHTKPWTCT